jgi:dipeptidyl aminopeptidase/acylaminoacyl peptidase
VKMSRSLCIAVLFALAPIASEAAPVMNPGLTVADLIGLTRFGSRLVGGFGDDDIVISPDAKRVAVVTQKGDLSRNAREFSLLIFPAAGRAGQSRPPQIAAHFTTTTNQAGIAQVNWLSNDSLMFLGQQMGAFAQVYIVNLSAGTLLPLTHAVQTIKLYGANPRGDVIAYFSERLPEPTSVDPRLNAHGFVIPTATSVIDVVAGKWDGLAEGSSKPDAIHFVRHGQDREVPLPVPAGYVIRVRVSPSGEFALVLCDLYGLGEKRPAEWVAYAEKHVDVYPWWIVVDLRTGGSRPLTGSPEANARYEPLWTSDSSSVVLVNDLLPLDGVSATEREARAKRRMTAEVNLVTGDISLVTQQEGLGLLSWDSVSKTIVLQIPDTGERGRAAARIAFRKGEDSRWSALPAVTARKAATVATLQVVEGINEPWKLGLIDPKTRRMRTIYDPNGPALSSRRLARETQAKWTTHQGAELEAGIYWPLDYVPGRRYPVVIQTHGFREERFSPDGYATSGYAAQPMAAAGILVVQAQRTIKGTLSWDDLREGERTRSAFESVIDYLDGLGLIDRNRVALQGYSRSCYHELYFLTHSPYPIKAAICTDGIDAGYLSELIFDPSAQRLAIDYADLNGGSPFGATLKTWMELSPGFNLDRVTAPVQLVCLGEAGYSVPGAAVLAEWQTFAGLHMLDKPVELLFLPTADHNVMKPWDRFASQQDAVDWFRFWLQGYERTEPVIDAQETTQSLGDQYTRWRKLREQSAKSNSHE